MRRGRASTGRGSQEHVGRLEVDWSDWSDERLGGNERAGRPERVLGDIYAAGNVSPSVATQAHCNSAHAAAKEFPRRILTHGKVEIQEKMRHDMATQDIYMR